MTLNINAAKELAKKYRSITVKDVKATRKVSMKDAMLELTGYSNPRGCTLCIAAAEINMSAKCYYCIYSTTINKGISHFCIDNDNRPTYINIGRANTIRELKKVLNARAEHIESIVAKIESESK